MSEKDVQKSAGTEETAKKADAPAKQGGSKKTIIIAVVLVLAAAIGAFLAMNSDQLTSPVKKVGSIDREAIFSLEAFTKAEKELQTAAEAKQKEFEKAAKKRTKAKK